MDAPSPGCENEVDGYILAMTPYRPVLCVALHDDHCW